MLRTDYIRALDIWQKHLPRGRLLVLFHDDIARAPADVIARTCEFLGIAKPTPRGGAEGMTPMPQNIGRTSAAWPELARVKAALSRRWLRLLVALESRFGPPVDPWRLAAEARLRGAEAAQAGAGVGAEAARENTVANNLAQWDLCHPWAEEGDEWRCQARKCGVEYDDWKAGVMDRHLPYFPRGGTVLEIGPGHFGDCITVLRRGPLRTHLTAP